jgi:hypothetical protein
MTLINTSVIQYLVEDVKQGEELEQIHRCSECDGEWGSYLEVTPDHLVILGEGPDRPWTIAVGCEGYYQLGGRFE